MKYLILTSFFVFFFGCKESSPDNLEKWKQEVIEVENQFSAMAQSVGIEEAFLHYASEEAVIMRNNKVFEGKNALQEYFNNIPISDNKVSLIWAPDFVDVAESGDLAYTYGKYTYTVTDTSGQLNESKGIFHTVWKRQEDGKWKFVWD